MTAGPFVGWQVQGSAPSVQGALMAAIEAFCGERVKVGGAGRTDAGVHALGQVAHVDLAKDWDADTVRDAITAHLRPQPVVVLAAEKVPDTFDARFSAMQAALPLSHRQPPRAISRSSAGARGGCRRPLDHEAMHAAAQRLVGRHDFTTFRHVDCQAKSPVKTLDRLDVTRQGEELSICASARSFLHSQVRSMVGALVFVGEGRWSADDLSAALAARDRTACAPVAPPEGLYLVQVDY